VINDDAEERDVTQGDRSREQVDVLGAAIEDVFDRLMTLDEAMGALADAEVGMAQALARAEAVTDAYRDRPECAETLFHLDELCEVACRNLAILARERPLAMDVDDGPPARGSSPQLVAPPRARRDTLADCPHALRILPGNDEAGSATARTSCSSSACASEEPHQALASTACVIRDSREL
jgi:hypothetical protein